MLKQLKTSNVGPSETLTAEFGSRLNLVTGDNGLGKSFLLDVAYWCVTGVWPNPWPVLPRVRGIPATIEHVVSDMSGRDLMSGRFCFEPAQQQFLRNQDRGWIKRHPDGPGLILYAKSDMGVSVAHTMRSSHPHEGERHRVFHRGFDFSAENIASGLLSPGDGNGHPATRICRGLIEDWALWSESRPESESARRYETLREVVHSLFDKRDEVAVGGVARVYLDNQDHQPLLNMPYGPSAYRQWSASIRRIVNLAYILVWAWGDHVERARLTGTHPTNTVVLLVDEIEAHLHPTWQRQILPALLHVIELLNPEAKVQLLATTHSPLVLASAEPLFDRETDRLFLFEREAGTGRVTFEDFDWSPNGDTDAWLTSPIFGLERPRSLRAERALIAAEDFLLGRRAELPEGLATREDIEAELRRVLPAHDWFWPRWMLQPQT
jgi:hypothetical protein